LRFYGKIYLCSGFEKSGSKAPLKLPVGKAGVSKIPPSEKAANVLSFAYCRSKQLPTARHYAVKNKESECLQ